MFSRFFSDQHDYCSLLILSVLCKGFQCLKGFCMFVFTDSTHFCYILNIYIQLLCCLFIKVGDTDWIQISESDQLMFKRIDLCSDLSAAQTCLFTFSQISFPSSSFPSSSNAFLLFLFLFLSSFSTYFLSLLTSFFPSLPLVSFLFPLLSPFVYVFSFSPPFLPDILLCFFVSFSISSFHVKFPSIFFPFFPNLIFSFLLSLPSVLALTHFYFLTSLFVSFCVLVPFLEGHWTWWQSADFLFVSCVKTYIHRLSVLLMSIKLQWIESNLIIRQISTVGRLAVCC